MFLKLFADFNFYFELDYPKSLDALDKLQFKFIVITFKCNIQVSSIMNPLWSKISISVTK